MATLSRDTDNANGKVSDGFEQGKIADRLEIQREAVALSVQTMGAVQSRLKADKENEIAAKLSAQGLTSEQIAASPEYKQVGQDYGIGGKYWTAGVSFTSALSGLLGGNIQGAAAGAAAPYLANLVKQISGGDEPLRIMLHTALGAFLASAQGGDAAAGAAGALTSAGTADLFIKMFYPMVKEGELTEAQKQVIDNLVVIAGSTAGGLASGSLSGVGSGANTAKNEVENNYLSDKQKTQREKEVADCKDSTACKLQVGSKWDLIDAGQQTSYGAGMLVGVPAGLVDSVQSIVNMGLNPAETYDALKSLFNSGDVLGNVSDAVKQSYITRLNNMEAEYQKAGASGSFNAGVEGGKLISEIASLAAGGAGVAKGGAVLVEKVAAKVVSKAENVTGHSIAQFPSKLLGEYSAIKPGPLDNDLAGTFSGGRYKEMVLLEDTILYRGGVSDKPYGQFFSSEAPQGVLQTRIDKAVLPKWPGGGTSPIDTSFAINIPAGTKVYVGEVGTQNGLYIGGTQQIVVVKPWAIKGTEIIESRPLK